MSRNIGRNLKILAIVLLIIVSLGCLVTAIIVWANGHGYAPTVIIGFAVLIGGFLVQLIFSFMMYGLGQLIENSDELVYLSHKLSSAPSQQQFSQPQPYEVGVFKNLLSNSTSPETDTNGQGWKCPKCGATNKKYDTYCKDCGKYR